MAKNNDMSNVLKQLKLDNKNGRYENHFYVIQLDDSDDYARLYTHLSNVATNTEYPSYGVNTNKSLVKVTNYFETTVDNVDYNIFLFADMENDSYYIRIGEKH